jgi:thymidylate synthase
MIPEELIGNLGDVHLYLNHIGQAREQIGSEYTPEDRANLLKEAMGADEYASVVKELMPFGGGMSEFYAMHNIPRTSRDPYPLPKLNHLKTSEFYRELSENLSLFGHLDPADFQLENYQSHPSIKAPLSN